MKNLTKTYPILYSKDNKGKIRMWWVEVKPIDPIGGELVIEHGLLKGKRTIKTRRVTKGKNIGKSNQTEPFEQACKDAESLIRQQKDKAYYSLEDLNVKAGYTEGVQPKSYYKDEEGNQYNWLEDVLLSVLPDQATSATGLLKPAKYQKYRIPEYKEGSKEYKKSRTMPFPCYVMPKLDGVCSVFDRTTNLSTRGGKKSLVKGGAEWDELCPQIVKDLQDLGYPYPLNGEIYKHGYSLQEIKDACTKQSDLSSELEFHIFNIMEPDHNFRTHNRWLKDIEIAIRAGGYKYIKVIPCKMIFNIEELLAFEDEMLELGYEGIMVYSPSATYKLDYRTPHILKLVRMDSMEVLVKDIIPYDNEPDLGKFVCTYQPNHKHYQNGKKFSIDPGFGFDKAYKAKLLANKQDYIGKLLTISHRGFTVHNLPRIPKGENGNGKAFRELNDLS